MLAHTSSSPNKMFIDYRYSIFLKLCLIFVFTSIVKTVSLNHTGKSIANPKNKDNGSLSTADKELDYDALYQQLEDRNYKFARYGNPCDMATRTELEELIELARSVVKTQNPDGLTHSKKPIQPHLKPKINAFFLRSVHTCDFRHLLTCDKKTRKCMCSHSSMDPAHDSSAPCRIKIGKSCNFSEDWLQQMGIPSIPSEPLNTSCAGENSECVSIDAASKICRCKSGSQGQDCKSTEGQNTLQLGPGLTKSTTTSQYLFPFEVIAAFVELMKKRNMFKDDESRQRRAKIIYDKFEADEEHDQMVTRDIFIRRKSTLKFGDACDSSFQDHWENPPVAQDDRDRWVDPNPSLIRNWQTVLVEASGEFCNFEDYLKCDKVQNVCVCLDGMEHRDGKCRIKLGERCGFDFISPFQFDPLKGLQRFTRPPAPACGDNATCELKPLLFTRQCSCFKDKDCSTNGEEDKDTTHLKQDIDQRFTLNLEDDCDPEEHKLLLYPDGFDTISGSQRISELESLVANTSTKFCNLDKFLNCSFFTKKCECLDPLVPDNGECRARNLDSCDTTFSHGQSFTFTGPKMAQIEKTFGMTLNPKCISAADCDELTKKCKCKNMTEMAGPLCKHNKSSFASVLSLQNAINYESEKEVVDVFHALNFFTSQAEQTMTRSHDEECDANAGSLLNLVTDFYQRIGSSNDNVAAGKSLYDYKKVLKWSENFVKTGVQTSCNGLNGLQCNTNLAKCQCPKGLVFQNGSCRLQANARCDASLKADWAPTCRIETNCTLGLSNFRHSCLCPPNQFFNETAQICQQEKCSPDSDENCGIIGPIVPIPEDEKNLLEMIKALLDRVEKHFMWPIHRNHRCHPANERGYHLAFPRMREGNGFNISDKSHIMPYRNVQELGVIHFRLEDTVLRLNRTDEFPFLPMNFCNYLQGSRCLDNGRCFCPPECRRGKFDVICNNDPHPDDFQKTRWKVLLFGSLCRMIDVNRGNATNTPNKWYQQF